MRFFSWRKLALWGALTASALSSGTARAQEGYRYEVSPASYTNELTELRSRLDAAEAALKNLEAAQDDKKKSDSSCKEVPIITKPTHKIIGRLFIDHLMVDQSALHKTAHGDGDNRTRFDTARIGVEGDLYEGVGYKMEMAFGEQSSTTDEPVFKDVYIEVKNLAYLQNVRVGHFKEPFSLEELTSARFITFMERSYLNAFVPARNLGIMEFGHFTDDEYLSWYTGLFRSEIADSPPTANEDSSDWSWTSRVAWNPYYDEPSEGRYLVHLGGAYSFREYGDDTVAFSKDHELNIVFPTAIFAPNFAVQDESRYGLEAALVWASLHVSAEWVHSDIDATVGAINVRQDAYYVQVGYFLTGEHKGYKKSSHAFDRTKVLEPFFSVMTCDGVCRGLGAIELKVRYSWLESDIGVLGTHQLEGISAGVNWYLNDHCRAMLDYIYGEDNNPVGGGTVAAGSVNQVGLRFQVDW